MSRLLSGYVVGAYRDRTSRHQAAEAPPDPPRPKQGPTGPTGTREGGRRKYPPLKVGDIVGVGWRVVALLPRDSTSNEKVETECVQCGVRSHRYAFNARRLHGCRCSGYKSRMNRSLAHTSLVNAILDVAARLPWLALWPNRSGRLLSTSGRTIPVGLCRGASDLIGILDGGLFLAIEVKTGRARTDAFQEEFLRQIRARQGVAFIVRNLADVSSHLSPYLTRLRCASLADAIGEVHARTETKRSRAHT